MVAAEPLSGRSSLSTRHSSRHIVSYILMALLAFTPVLEGGTTHLAMMIMRVLLLLALAAFFYQHFPSGQLPCAGIPLMKPIALYLGLALVSVMASSYMNQSVQWLTILGGYAVALYLFTQLTVLETHAGNFMLLAIFLGLIEALYAGVQWWAMGMTRPTGTFFNTNFLSVYEASIGMIAVAALCHAPWSRLRRRKLRICEGWVPLAFVSALASVGAVLLTGSRGGALAFTCGIAFITGLRWGWKGCASIVFGIMLLILMASPFRNRVVLEHLANPESYARWHMWLSALREMSDYPFGIGLGLYQYTYPLYAFPVEGEIARYGKVAFTPHNEFLQMGIELGIVSVPVFLWGIVRVCRAGFQGLRERLTRRQRILLVGAVGGAGVILFHSAIDSTLHEPALVLLLIVYVSILLGHQAWGNMHTAEVPRVMLPSGRGWGIAVAVIWGLLFLHVVRIGGAYMTYESGMTWSAQGQYARAIHDLNWSVALDPGKALFHQALGAAHFQMYGRTGSVDELQVAKDQLMEAIQLNPLDGHLNAVLGGVYARAIRTGSEADLGMSREHARMAALQAYQEASRLQPFAYSHRFELAKLFEELQEEEKARRVYLQVVDLEPNFLPARERLARIHLRAGERAAAQTQYDAILRVQKRYAMYTYDPYAQIFLNANPAVLEAELRAESRKT